MKILPIPHGVFTVPHSLLFLCVYTLTCQSFESAYQIFLFQATSPSFFHLKEIFFFSQLLILWYLLLFLLFLHQILCDVSNELMHLKSLELYLVLTKYSVNVGHCYYGDDEDD